MIDHSYSKHSPLYGSGGSRGGAQGARGPPLFLDQTEARRPKKIFLENTPPLSQGLDARPPPLPIPMRILNITKTVVFTILIPL